MEGGNVMPKNCAKEIAIPILVSTYQLRYNKQLQHCFQMNPQDVVTLYMPMWILSNCQIVKMSLLRTV